MRARTLLTASAAAPAGLAAGVAVAAARPRPLVADSPPPVPPPLPPGRTLLLPERGEILLRELPGPGPGAPTVLLLHGWVLTADVHFFKAYEPLGRVARVLAYDHRGHGHGLRPARPFRLTDAADDAAAVLDTLGTGPVIAVGYSMGGPVAQLLWRRRPDLVRGLVLCATSASFDTPRDRWVWRGMGLYQLALRLLPRHVWERGLQAQAEGRIPQVFSRFVHPGTPAHVLDALPWIVGEADRGSAEDVAEAGRELGRYDASAWIGAVDVPAAVLVTTQDRLVSPERQRELAARIRGARVLEVVGDHDAVVGDRFVSALVGVVTDLAAPQPQRARLTG
jgi:pimeloyl-ACP methyl ester carboxylesterase